MKTFMMLFGLAALFAGGTACFVAPPRTAPPADPGSADCAGLDGEAKRQCEKRQAP